MGQKEETKNEAANNYGRSLFMERTNFNFNKHILFIMLRK